MYQRCQMQDTWNQACAMKDAHRDFSTRVVMAYIRTRIGYSIDDIFIMIALYTYCAKLFGPSWVLSGESKDHDISDFRPKKESTMLLEQVVVYCAMCKV